MRTHVPGAGFSLRASSNRCEQAPKPLRSRGMIRIVDSNLVGMDATVGGRDMEAWDSDMDAWEPTDIPVFIYYRLLKASQSVIVVTQPLEPRAEGIMHAAA